MKIKSWTGNDKYVDARVGMVIKIGDYDVTTILNHNDMRFTELCRVDDGCAFNAMMKDCTMLHCPFVVGDEVVWRNMTGIIVGLVDNDGVEAIPGSPEVILEQIFVFEARGRKSLAKESELTHANPDLRDSPEYAP